MATTLFDLVLRIGEFVSQDFVTSAATSGSSLTSIIDATRTERDEFWNGGTLMIKRIRQSGIPFAGKVMRVITDYDLPTTKISFLGDVWKPMEEGTEYALIGPDYTKIALLRGINEALLRIGGVIRYNETTLVVDGQQAYDLPLGVSDDVRRVEVDSYQTPPYYTSRHYFWEVINRKLIFDEGSEPWGDYRIRIFYNQPLVSLALDTDELPADTPAQAVYLGGVYYCLKEKLRKTRQSDPVVMALLAEAERDWKSALAGIQRLPRDPHLIYWSENL